MAESRHTLSRTNPQPVANGDPAGSSARRSALGRRRSASSRENDDRLLDAALEEIATVGIDGLGMSSVARRAGLTTGALYGRYENVNELAADVWMARVRDTHLAFLDRAVRALVDRDPAVDLTEIVRELLHPSREMVAALELLATARRIDELEEVVPPDVEEWIRGWGAAPRTRGRRRRAQVVFTLGAVWGIVLHAIPRRQDVDWVPVLARAAECFAHDYEPPPVRFVPERAGAVHANVGDPAQDALIDSVAAITARVGFERATTSRIARRARLTSGAIYTRYRSKDDLLAHAVEVLLAQRLADDLDANTYLFTAPDVGSATASVIGGYLGPARREWRSFRVEAQLASRYRPGLAFSLARVQELAIRAYLEALGARREEEFVVLDPIARFAQLIPLGLAFADMVATGVPGIDWRYAFVPVLAPESL